MILQQTTVSNGVRSSCGYWRVSVWLLDHLLHLITNLKSNSRIIFACLTDSLSIYILKINFIRSSNTHQQILDGESNEAIVQPESALQVYFNVKVVLVMVVFISTTLMLLYFFFEYLVYFFMFVFCVASGRALFEVLVQLLNLCQINDQIPRIKGIGIHKILLTGICIALPLTWFFLRHTAYIWILEDLLGVCFW